MKYRIIGLLLLMRFLVNTFLFITTLLFCGCHVKDTISVSHMASETAENTEPEQIIFLNFKIKKDSLKGSTNVILTNKQVVYGHLKNKRENCLDHSSSTFLNYKITDSNNKPVCDCSIDHPLLKAIEYLGTEGEMGRKEVEVMESDFFIRVEYNKHIKQIIFTEKTKESSLNKISTISLN